MKTATMYPIKKYDVVSGWFGVGTITDIAEFDDLVVVRQGRGYRVISASGISKNLTTGEKLTGR